MARMCSYCGQTEAAPGRRFCSPECMDMWDMGYRIRTCTVCGKTFRRSPKSNRVKCPACIYNAHFAATINQRQPKAAHEDKIAAVIAEQKRIYDETGKWLTYGQIVARKGTK